MTRGRIGRIGRPLLIALLALVVVVAASVVVLKLTNPRPETRLLWLRAQAMPSPRGEVAAAMVGSSLVVSGGLHGVGRTSSAVSVYDVRQRQWFIGPPLPAARHHAAAAALDGRLYVTGGATSATDWTPRDNVWRYRVGGGWDSVPAMPEGRVGHAMVTIGSRMYVIGGVGRTARTLVYDAKAGWSAAAPLPSPRDHLRAVVWDKKVWVIGGRGSGLTRRIDIYNPESDSWTRGPDLPKPMSAMAVAVLGGNLHVVGGENPAFIGGGVMSDHFFLRAGSKRWERRARPPLAVHGAGFGDYQGVMFIAGGAARQGALSVLSWTNVTQIYSTIPQKRL